MQEAGKLCACCMLHGRQFLPFVVPGHVEHFYLPDLPRSQLAWEQQEGQRREEELSQSCYLFIAAKVSRWSQGFKMKCRRLRKWKHVLHTSARLLKKELLDGLAHAWVYFSRKECEVLCK